MKPGLIENDYVVLWHNKKISQTAELDEDGIAIKKREIKFKV